MSTVNLATAFILFGALGLLASTILLPVLARLLFPKKSRKAQSSEKVSLSILIPAHNEEAVLAQTLNSIYQAALQLHTTHENKFILQIILGLDHCTDRSEFIANQVAERIKFTHPQWELKILHNKNDAGKWNTLKMLISSSNSDWSLLVDSGTIWNKSILSSCWSALLDNNIIAIAPAYIPHKCSLLEQYSWKLEQSLKKIESEAGGPVSVHGASVFYRTEPLKMVLLQEQNRNWLNDDIIIPLLLRIQNPEHHILYIDKTNSGEIPVSDIAVSKNLKVELGRRKRMIQGNLDWIAKIWLRNLFKRPSVSILAARRVARLFWAYWILSILIGSTLYLYKVLPNTYLIHASVVSAFLVIFLLRSNWMQRLSMAFIAGLQIPFIMSKLLIGKKGINWS